MKKTKPIVSIIMNCHNGQKYIRESLSSIQKQTFNNWETIFFDNQSNDNSLEIANSFKEDKRIKIFKSIKKMPLYEARNEAIKKTRGIYIAFLDTDDFWLPKKLELQLECIKKKKCEIIFSNFYVKRNKKKFLRLNKNILEVKTQGILNDYYLGILTGLINKKFFKKGFNRRYNFIGDFDFFLKLSLKHKICFINRPLATYRLHNDNLSIKNKTAYINELQNWLSKNEKKMNKLGLSLIMQKKNLIKLRIRNFFNLR